VTGFAINTPAPNGREALTDRQAAVLAVIRAYRAIHGWWPTRREIQESMVPEIGNVNGLTCHVVALEKKGYLVRHRYQARALEVVG
jgi:repressor LexA